MHESSWFINMQQWNASLEILTICGIWHGTELVHLMVRELASEGLSCCDTEVEEPHAVSDGAFSNLVARLHQLVFRAHANIHPIMLHSNILKPETFHVMFLVKWHFHASLGQIQPPNDCVKHMFQCMALGPQFVLALDHSYHFQSLEFHLSAVMCCLWHVCRQDDHSSVARLASTAPLYKHVYVCDKSHGELLHVANALWHLGMTGDKAPQPHIS